MPAAGFLTARLMNVTSAPASTLMSAVGLQKFFPIGGRLPFGRPAGWVKAVDGVSFEIGEGETYSLVGETGCGKTTIVKMILLVLQPTAGDIFFRGKKASKLTTKDLRQYRSSVQAVFQDPWSSLSPRMRVEDIVIEPLLATRQLTRREARRSAFEVLEEVGLPAGAGRRFPHEFSGGQRQRIAIARALSSKPKLIVLDEPVSSLDVSIRAQTMNLLKDVQQRSGVSYMLIAHDLATVRYLSHRVGVLYLGKIVEEGTSATLFDNPMHPYTKALVSASLPAHPDSDWKTIVLTGEVPSPVNRPDGCPFHPRCPSAMPKCATIIPEWREVQATRKIACHLY